jgi:hypothetical protein
MVIWKREKPQDQQKARKAANQGKEQRKAKNRKTQNFP